MFTDNGIIKTPPDRSALGHQSERVGLPQLYSSPTSALPRPTFSSTYLSPTSALPQPAISQPYLSPTYFSPCMYPLDNDQRTYEDLKNYVTALVGSQPAVVSLRGSF